MLCPCNWISSDKVGGILWCPSIHPSICFWQSWLLNEDYNWYFDKVWTKFAQITPFKSQVNGDFSIIAELIDMKSLWSCEWCDIETGPLWHQAITSAKFDLSSNGPSETYFHEILIKFLTFSLKQMQFEMPELSASHYLGQCWPRFVSPYGIIEAEGCIYASVN